MMKNKFLVGVITFFITITCCILFLNFFNPSKKTYYFDRVESSNTILTFDKEFHKLNNDEYVKYIYSDSLIIEHDVEILDENRKQITFYITDKNFENKFTKKVILPKNSNVLFCNKEYIFFTDNFNLFTLDFITNKQKQVSDNRIKIFSLKTIPNSKSKILCFGEYKQNNIFKTGFFVFDYINSKVIISKILENNPETNMPKNALVYAGFFNLNYEKSLITFTCNKYSKIYLFDSNGLFTSEMNTKDNVPLPEIFTNERGDSFYSRGNSWTTNMGMFIKNNKIFVFSNSSSEKFKLIIDEYSCLNNKYIKSYKLNYLNQSAKDIRNVFIEKDKIIIGFEFNYASFIFSRYI